MEDRNVVVIVVDALRPDSITPQSMPVLSSLAEGGVQFQNHWTCTPSKTRVNSATIATGCYPGTHGLVNNELYIPGFAEVINVANYKKLMELDRSLQGPLLSVPTLMERLHRSGRSVALSTASSSGTSFIQNPTACGFSVNNGSPSYVFPEERESEIVARFGAPPKVEIPDVKRNEYAAAVLVEYIIPELRPDLALIWFSDPDKTQHPHSPGAPASLQALAVVDRCIKSIMDKLEEQNLLAVTDVIIVSDHGCISADPDHVSTDRETERALQDRLGSGILLVNGNSIYVTDADRKHKLAEVVSVLQQQRDMGAIFSSYPLSGTLPLSLINQEHERSPDLFFFPRWTSEANKFGVEGVAKGTSKHGHGGTSPYELNAVLIAYGPSFQKGTKIITPSGNVDIAPTVLHLFGEEVDPAIQGRVLLEGLRDGVSPAEIAAHQLSFGCTAENDHVQYQAVADIARVGQTYYLRQANGCQRHMENGSPA